MYKNMNENKFRNILIGVIILLLIIVGVLYKLNSNKNVDLEIYKQNQSALNDSVRVSKNKVGDLEFSKNILIADKNTLEKLNKELYDEFKKEKGKVSELSSLIASIKSKPNDTIKIPSDLITYPNGDRGLAWKYDTIFNNKNYRKVEGVSKFKINFSNLTYEIIPLSTEITKFDLGFNIIQGLRENKNGEVEMFVRSDHPGFEVNDLNSMVISPDKNPILKKFSKSSKQKRFGFGFYGGYGLNINNSTVLLAPQFGVGFNYSLFNF
jgi:hypothetical protein